MVKKIKKTEKKGVIFKSEGVPFIGGLLRGIEKFIGLAERAEKAGGKIETKGEFRGLGRNEGITGRYKFSIRTGIEAEESQMKTKEEIFKEGGENK